MEKLVLIISLISGTATIVSFLMEKAGLRGKWIHALYGFFIALVSSVLVASFSSFSAEHDILQSQISQLTSIQYQAATVVKHTPKSNDGERRGFMFASLAFLESHKEELPDTYKMAREFAIASGILENKQEDGLQRLYQEWSLQEGSDAMEALLKGISGNTQLNKN